LPEGLTSADRARSGLAQRIAREIAIIGTNVARETSKLLRKLLAPRGMRELPPKYPQDFSPFSRRLCARVRPYTMTSLERVLNLEYAVRYIVAHRIGGAFVECGVGAGGSMMAVAWTLLELGAGDRLIYLYDTFEGMPAPTDADVSVFGKPASRKYRRKIRDGQCTWHNFPIETVRENLRRTAYPEANLRFVKGRVEDTLPANDIDRIALLRLDTNLYESTRAELAHLFPKLAAGGVLIVDDYSRWLGQRRALEEYFATHAVRMLLTRIDDHAVMGVKQS
jgi:hypothetical protein